MIEPVQQHKTRPKLVTSLKPQAESVQPTVKPARTWQTLSNKVVSPQYSAIPSPQFTSSRPASSNSGKPARLPVSVSPQPTVPKRPVDRYTSLARRSHSSSNNVSGVNSPLIATQSINHSPVQLGTAATAIQLHKLAQHQSLSPNIDSGSDTSSDAGSNTYSSNYNAVLSSLQANVQSTVDTICPRQRSRIPSTSSENSIRNSSSRRVVASQQLHAPSSDDDDDVESQYELDSDDSDGDTQPTQYERVLSLDRLEPVSVAIERRKKLRKFGDAALDGRLYRTDVSQSIRDENTGLLLSLAPLPQKAPTSDAHSTTVQLEPIELKLFPQKLHENTDTAVATLGKELNALMTNNGVIKCSNCHQSGHYSRHCKLASKQRTNSVISTSTDNTELPSASNKRSGVVHSNVVDVQIHNLPPETVKQDVYDLAACFGRVKRVTVPTDRHGNCKGVAYVTYVRAADAATAIQQLDKYAYGGCVLNVNASINTY